MAKETEKNEVQQALSQYIRQDVVADFSQFTEPQKLTLLQKTPKDYIQERDIAGKTFLYVEYQYARKAMNFVFNFRVSNEVVSKEYREFEEEYKDYKDSRCKKDNTGRVIPMIKTRKVMEAEVTMKFTFKYKDGSVEVRTVQASHKGYPNPATTRSNIMEAAFSKSWTKVAATFGIGDELEKNFESQVDSEPDVVEYEEEPTKKTFGY